MIYTTSVSKNDLGLPTNGGLTHVKLTAENRRAALALAVCRALDSFPSAELCPITCTEFHEWPPSDLSAARITLDIGGPSYGGLE